MSAPGGRQVVGLHPVRELLRVGSELRAIHIAEDRRRSEVLDEIVELAASQGVPVERIERDALDRLAPGLVHQGVVADAPVFPTSDLDGLLDRLDADAARPLLIALDGVTDPHNVGSIARSAEAVGAHALLLPSRRTAHVTPTVEKAAAGALAHLPVVDVTNLGRTLRHLHDRGVWSIGLDADAPDLLQGHPLAGEACVLVVGSEGDGLGRLVRERCDALVRLEMHGRVGSLNASVAAAVAAYTLLRARS